MMRMTMRSFFPRNGRPKALPRTTKFGRRKMPLPTAFAPLTVHPTESMLGAARCATLKSCLGRIRRFAGDTSRIRDHSLPFSMLISSPRQGKTRWLDELCAAANTDSRICAVPISYNGDVAMCAKDYDPEHFVARFYWRVLCSLRYGNGATSYLDDFIYERVAQLGIDETNHVAVQDLAEEMYDVEGKKLVVCADEFSRAFLALRDELRRQNPQRWETELRERMAQITKSGWGLVFTGFTPSFHNAVVSASGRSTVRYFLPLVTHVDRHEYAELYDALTEHYRASNVPFPTYVYEVVKCSPGLLGQWLEMVATADFAADYPGTLSDLGTNWWDKVEDKAAELVPLAEGYLSAWGKDPDSKAVGAHVRAMVEKDPPLAIAVSMEASIPHAFPFAALCSAVDPSMGARLLSHVEAALGMVRKYCESPGAADLRVKGRLLEDVLCVAMGLKFAAMGTTELHSLRSCIGNWLGPTLIGGMQTTMRVRAREDKWIQEVSTANEDPDAVECVADALAKRAVIHPRNENNRGCDVVGVLDEAEGGVVLLLLESKYTTAVSTVKLREKAQNALEDVLELSTRKSHLLGGRRIAHVAFTVVLAGGMGEAARAGTFDDEVLAAAIGELGKLGVPVSLHLCCGPQDMQRLLTPPIYHVIPDGEYHAAGQNDGVPRSHLGQAGSGQGSPQ